MKSLKDISAYRVVFFIVLSLYFKTWYITLALILLSFIYNKYESILIVILLSLIILFNYFSFDFIPIGIVERVDEKTCVVDKILYKEEIKNNVLNIGDVIYTSSSDKYSDLSKQKNNIRFYTDNYDYLFNVRIRNIVYNYIQSFDINCKTILNKFLYNIVDYDNLSFNLGYGYSIYYLFKLLIRKNKKIGSILLLLFITCFTNNLKFYLLVIDLLLDKFKDNKYYLKLLIISLLNINLFNNVSILFVLLCELYEYIDLKCSFKGYFIVIESILFGYVDLISLFLYNTKKKLSIFMLCICFGVLFFPFMEDLFIKIINIYSKLNDVEIIIRGKLSIFSIVLYFILIECFTYQNQISVILILLLLINPTNNPFMHVSFIDVGQGDATLIYIPFNGTKILIDTGSTYNYYKLKKYLFSQGIYKIDYLIITHNDSDHNGNVDSIFSDFSVNNLITSGIDIDEKDIRLKYLNIGEFDNDNDSSLLYYTNIEDISYLFTGDISSKAEYQLIKKYGDINVDVLKVSHHGSKTSTSPYFVGNTLPSIAIISTSGMYNHPSSETMSTLDNYMVKTYITKTEGDIEIYMTKLINILKTANGEFVIIR